MKTPEKTNGAVQGTATAEINNAAKTNVQTVNRPNIPGKDKDKSDEPPKTGPEAPGAATLQNSAQPKAEEPKKEEPKPEEQQPKEEAKPAKPELTLEAKIKAVNDLHRKTIQRLTLIARLKTLEEFEVRLIEENDELENNPYQGCKLIIEDDKGRKFTTNTPGLIRLVAQFLFDTCENKLVEIESTINFPQA